MVVHLALLELGVPYQLRLVDFTKNAQHSADYLALNPHGVVPTLIIDGLPYIESAALLMMLADRHPDSPLGPPRDSAQRNAWYQWIVYLTSALGTSYRFWFYPAELGATEHPAAVHGALQARIGAVWTRLDAQLAARGPYLLGSEFSGADLLLIMYMRWSRNMPRPALEWPALNRFATLMRARPSWQKLCELENLTEWRS